MTDLVKPLILLIEDNPSIYKLIAFKLNKEEAYRFEHRDNGIEGLDAARELKPDLIILDVMMPGMNGFEVLHRLRDEADLADTKVMMLTSKAREEDLERGFKYGVAEYMSKPFKMGELLMRIKRILT